MNRGRETWAIVVPRYFPLEPVSYELRGYRPWCVIRFASAIRGEREGGSSLSVETPRIRYKFRLRGIISRLNGGKDVELCGSCCAWIYFKELPLFVFEKCSSCEIDAR